MKRIAILIITGLVLNLLMPAISLAQCAMCAKTAQQMGEKPAQGMNSGILYLMIMPFAVVGVIAFRWWKNNGSRQA
ncbi:MAG: hypothetical protein HY305_02765 [Sphingobacteriales bacterium]|nr:hypothetical protein [Sphingobacteriales bacterium]